MESGSTSEKYVNFYQRTQLYKSGDSHLPTYSNENLKSYIKINFTSYKLLQRNFRPTLRVFKAH